MAELGPLVPQDVLLEGASWKESSVDIAIAGNMTSRLIDAGSFAFLLFCTGLGCQFLSWLTGLVRLRYICACAGLGWIAVGVKGPADLRVWVHEGVSVTTHASILPDYARDLERPGFSQSNIKVAIKQTSV